jgi:putative oxygen-independent coproporphyrinogen III oxidase
LIKLLLIIVSLSTTSTVSIYVLKASSAYLHIPFCRRRCYYCDFPVYVVGDQRRGENSQMVQTYVEVLCAEISLATPDQPLQTVFFGGGTPSLLAPSQLSQILQMLDHRLGIAAGAEISMEIDPGTFDGIQLAAYAAAGINRVSMGVQAWQDELLQLCGRSHNVADIEKSLAIIQASAIGNWSLDLISGLPQQTMSMWEESLGRSIAAHPRHISVYDLIVEPQTPFAKQYQPDCRPLPSDETTAQMYRVAQQFLTTAGYEHYEISNYAQPGSACRHNQVYWRNQSYYAFGMGAASYLEGQRFTRPRYTQDYFDWVAAGAILPVVAANTPLDDFLETLMLGLRTAEGLNISVLIDKFGLDLWQQADQRLVQYSPHWVTQATVRGASSQINRLCLTDPEGFLYSNVVLADLFEIENS